MKYDWAFIGKTKKIIRELRIRTPEGEWFISNSEYPNIDDEELDYNIYEQILEVSLPISSDSSINQKGGNKNE